MTAVAANFSKGTSGSSVLVADAGDPTAFDAVTPGAAAITYDTAHHPSATTQAAKFVIGASTANPILSWSTAQGTLSDLFGRFYYYGARPAGSAQWLVEFLNGAGVVGSIRVNNTGHIVIADGPSSVSASSTAVIAASTLYRFDFHVTCSATVGVIAVKIFSSPESAGAADETLTFTTGNTDTQCTETRFGSCSNSLSNITFWMGGLQSGQLAYPGPLVIAPTNSVAPAVTGTATVGQTLSTTDGTWTGSPTFTYQWQRAGSNIAAATSNTYVLVDADDGSAIRCVVTGTNSAGNASANSNATSAVIEPAPTNSVVPALGGTNATVGAAITVGTGTWANMAGAGGSSFTYQWRDCSTSGGTYADIASATSSSYTVGVGEATKFLKCVVTAHNTNGSTGSATTVASNQVAAAAASTGSRSDPSKTASAVVILGL